MEAKHNNSLYPHLNCDVCCFISSYFKPEFLLFLFEFMHFYLYCVFWSFYKSRSQDSTLSTVSSVAPSSATEGIESMRTSLSTVSVAPPMCQEDLCHNGGTCHPVSLPSGTFSLHCDCPLHFTGRFCEQGKQSSFVYRNFSRGDKRITTLL